MILLEICKLQSSYMFKVALATTVCYDKSCINYKKARNKDSTVYGPTALKNKKLYEFRNEKVT
jgi:hypothetical protein